MEDELGGPCGSGGAVPITPMDDAPIKLPATPRQPHATRSSMPKKPRVEDSEKQRIVQLRETMEGAIRVVKFGDESYATLDGYDTDLNVDDLQERDYWEGEDNVVIEGQIPEELWSSLPTTKRLQLQLADEIEIARLLKMEVLQRMDEYTGTTKGTLTTRFVYDWGIKKHPSGNMM